MLRVRTTQTRSMSGVDLSDFLVFLRTLGVPEDVIGEIRGRGKAVWEDRDENGPVSTLYEIL